MLNLTLAHATTHILLLSSLYHLGTVLGRTGRTWEIYFCMHSLKIHKKLKRDICSERSGQSLLLIQRIFSHLQTPLSLDEWPISISTFQSIDHFKQGGENMFMLLINCAQILSFGLFCDLNQIDISKTFLPAFHLFSISLKLLLRVKSLVKRLQLSKAKVKSLVKT